MLLYKFDFDKIELLEQAGSRIMYLLKILFHEQGYENPNLAYKRR